MKIAGLEKLSLTDFPGYISAVVFLAGCNFRCAYCQNPDLVKEDPGFGISEEELFDYLGKRKNFIEGVVVSGGEPTIHKDLTALLKKIKENDFKVKLDTNGANPDLLKAIIREKCVDYIAIDVKTSFSKYDEVTSMKGSGEIVKESISIAMGSNIPYELRTTCVPGIVGEEDFILIGEALKGARKYCLQQFRPIVTLDKKFEKVKPYSKEKILKFKEILAKYFEVVEIRGF